MLIFVVFLMIVFFIKISPWLYSIHQRRKYLRLMDAVINQVQNFGTKDQGSSSRSAYPAEASANSGGFSTWLTFLAAVFLSFMAYKNNLINQASVARGPTGFQEFLNFSALTDQAAQEAPKEYSPLDAPRRKGVYESVPSESPEIPINKQASTAPQPVVLSGFGQQIISLRSRENVQYNLDKALRIYPEAVTLIIEEEQPDGSIFYKGVLGRFQNGESARNAFPKLQHLFKGRFPVNLEGLIVQN